MYLNLYLKKMLHKYHFQLSLLIEKFVQKCLKTSLFGQDILVVILIALMIRNVNVKIFFTFWGFFLTWPNCLIFLLYDRDSALMSKIQTDVGCMFVFDSFSCWLFFFCWFGFSSVHCNVNQMCIFVWFL